MIRVSALALLCLVAIAPVSAQPPQVLPPEVQEMVDKIHLPAEDGRLVAVEDVPTVFARLPSGDFEHRPSGFVCPHTPATIQDGMMPGFVSIFDDPQTGHDIGCGAIGRDINSSVFVFRSDKDLASVLADESRAGRGSSPPHAEAPQPVKPRGDSFGLPDTTAFAADTWLDEEQRLQSILIARIGDWYVSVRLTYSVDAMATARSHASRRFAEAMAQIRR